MAADTAWIRVECRIHHCLRFRHSYVRRCVQHVHVLASSSMTRQTAYAGGDQGAVDIAI